MATKFYAGRRVNSFTSLNLKHVSTCPIKHKKPHARSKKITAKVRQAFANSMFNIDGVNKLIFNLIFVINSSILDSLWQEFERFSFFLKQ